MSFDTYSFLFGFFVGLFMPFVDYFSAKLAYEKAKSEKRSDNLN